MNKLFESWVKNGTNVHRIRIYDSTVAEDGNFETLIAESPGYLLDYNSNLNNNLRGGIIQSEVGIFLQNKDSVMDTFLQDIVEAGEDKYLVQIDKVRWSNYVGAFSDSGGFLALTITSVDRVDVGDILQYQFSVLSAGDVIDYQGVAEVTAKAGTLITLDVAYPVPAGATLVAGLWENSVHILKPFWRGVLLQDFSSFEDSEFGTIRLAATDGLGQLSALDFDDIGFSTSDFFAEIRFYFAKILASIPSAGLWAAGDIFFLTKTDWYAERHETEPTDTDPFLWTSIPFHVWAVNSQIPLFYGYNLGLLETRDCRFILEHILTRFNASLLQLWGRWYIVQRDVIVETTSLKFLPYNKVGIELYTLADPSVGAILESVRRVVTPNAKGFRSGASFRFLPGLKEATTIYEGSSNYIAAIRFHPGIVDTYTIPYVPAAATLRLFLKFTEDITYNGVASFGARIRYVITIKLGSYYLKELGSQFPEWEVGVPTGSERLNIVSAPFTHDALTAIVDGWVFSNSEALPEEGELEISIERDAVVGNPGSTPPTYTDFDSPPEATNPILFDRRLEVLIDGEVSNGILLKATQDGEFASILNVGNTLFGSEGNNRLIDTSFVPDQSIMQFWAKGQLTVKAITLSSLLLEEAVQTQLNSLLVMDGTLIDRDEDANGRFTPLKAIRVPYKGETYSMTIDRVTYNPYLEEWIGNWVATAREIGVVTIDEVNPAATFEILPGNSVPAPLPANVIELNSAIEEPTVADINKLFLYMSSDGILKSTNEFGEKKIIGQDSSEVIIVQETKFGRLYNFYAASNVNLPSDADWQLPTFEEDTLEPDYDWSIAKLKDYLVATYAGAPESLTWTDWNDNNIGEALKASGTTFWETDNGLDLFNMSLRGGGGRSYNTGLFSGLKISGQFWTLTELGSNILSFKLGVLTDNIEQLQQGGETKGNGIPIILVRKATVTEQALADGTFVADYVQNNRQRIQAVKIGEQVWSYALTETEYNDGTKIPFVADADAWVQAGTGETAAVCNYDNDVSNALTETDEVIFRDEKLLAEEYISKNIRYRDEYVGGPWVEAAAQAAPDPVNVVIGGVSTRKYGFNGVNTEERLSNSFEIPHDIALADLNAGVVFIEAHIHWSPSSDGAGDVEWFFDWCYKPVHGAPIPRTTVSVVGEVAINQQYYHKINQFKDGSGFARLEKPTGDWGIGDIIEFTLRRTPNGTNDTYTADALLDKVALHVPVKDKGTETIF